MSYILEALKKADAERERERSAVPSLHAHTDALGFERERRSGAPAVKLVAGAAVLLVGGGVWWWWSQPPSSAAEPPPSAVAMPAPAAPPLPMPAAPTPAAPMPTAPPPAVAVAAPAPAPALAVAAPPPAALAPTPTRKPAAPTPAPAIAAGERVPTRNELPADMRAALPPLNVSGAVYAPAASGRMLFVNGLVLREGDPVADGLNVERIGRASSVLVFRGQRFELKH